MQYFSFSAKHKIRENTPAFFVLDKVYPKAKTLSISLFFRRVSCGISTAPRIKSGAKI